MTNRRLHIITTRGPVTTDPLDTRHLHALDASIAEALACGTPVRITQNREPHSLNPHHIVEWYATDATQEPPY